MSGKTALVGICLVLLVGAGAAGYAVYQRYLERPAPAVERTLPPLDIGRGRGLAYTFVDPGGALQTVDARDAVPEDAREFVKVDGPTVRRTDRTSSLVYVADLRTPAPDGSFPYKVMSDAQFRELVLPQSSDVSMHVKYEPEPAAPAIPPPLKKKKGAKATTSPRPPLPEIVRGPAGLPGFPAPAAAPGGKGLGAGKSVTLYTTAWCPACTQARTWLRARGVSFVEHDIEKEPGARDEYASKAARIGQSCCRIPGIDINGALMIGFAPGRVESLLRR